MKSFILLPVLFLLNGITVTLSAQSTSGMMNMEPAHYYDFWVGEWNLNWEDRDGTVGTGTNHIKYILNGKVIEENFIATDGNLKGYEGKSYSVFHPLTGQWRQTWVDNQGGYLDFTGEFQEGKRMFLREGMTPSGTSVVQRMVFYDITENKFTWDWEISEDSGKTWQLRWRINYTRMMSEEETSQ